MNEQSEAPPNRSVSGFLFALALWLLGAWVIVLGAREWLPSLASLHGAGIDQMITYLLVCTGALVLIGHLVLGYLILRSTRREKASSAMPTSRAERVWSIVPAIVMTLVAEGGVLVIGLPVWGQLYGEGPPDDAVDRVSTRQVQDQLRNRS